MHKDFLSNTAKFPSLKVVPIFMFEVVPLAVYELAYHLPKECSVILFNFVNLKDEKGHLCAVLMYTSLFINEVE